MTRTPELWNDKAGGGDKRYVLHSKRP
uniref:Uncharacterized protein n=1 Tax=Anguilla anguilla TaxID=7936 RepID=A0A0E9UTC5_ANGAN